MIYQIISKIQLSLFYFIYKPSNEDFKILIRMLNEQAVKFILLMFVMIICIYGIPTYQLWLKQARCCSIINNEIRIFQYGLMGIA